jgi:hypothetical protein
MHRHRQLHLWITEHDYVSLRALANERKETLSCVIRKLIKLQRAENDFAAAEPSDPLPAAPAG